MENKKAVIVTIVVLLLIFTPLTVISAFIKVGKNPLDENPGHDFKYKDALWFYDSNNKFLSSYSCDTKLCDLSAPIIDDDTYGINYYKDGALKQIEVIDEKYAFLTDGAVIHLYGVDSGGVIQTYKSVKNYNSHLENDAYIIQNNNDLWGVLGIGNTLKIILPFDYDFIGISNKINEEGIIRSDKFIVLKDNKWFLVDNANSALTKKMDAPIIDYTNEYIFVKESERIKIYNYEGLEYLQNYIINDFVILDNYIAIITNNELMIYNNLNNLPIKNIVISSGSKVTLEKNNNVINIKVNDIVIDTIA